ncbi:MAG: transcriptional regulator GlxA family with amidase domain [Gammaproteobacteria bacterium]|jgi:transcriptional regulator GlxA family with amidase domain
MHRAPAKIRGRARLSIGFVLARNFTLSAFANFIDVVRLAADEGDRSRPLLCNWRVLSSTGRPVQSSCGITVSPDERLSDPTKFDYIVVAGGLIADDVSLDRESEAFLVHAANAGVPLVGLCTGALILHQAGLMKGRRCCVSWFHHEDYLRVSAGLEPGLEPVSDQIFVVDGDRLTCAGGASAAQLAAYLVDKHVGAAQARKSLHIMIIDQAMSGTATQPGLPLGFDTDDELVKQALHLMQQSMFAPRTIDQIAHQLDVSRRNLERRFRRAVDLTPAQADRRLRVAHARFLMATTGRPLAEVAAETGFCDASHLIKVFKDFFEQTPDAFRSAARSG